MKKLLTALLAVILVLPARADVVDTGAVFDQDFRNQCDTGSCHAFASVALLEAALRRRHRDSERVLLSDADLFLRATVINGSLGLRYRGDPSNVETFLIEGGWPSRDLKLALEEGVALAETVPWDEFLVKFRDYRRTRLAPDLAKLPAPGGGKPPELAPGEKPPISDRTAADTAFFYGKDLTVVQDERARVKELLAGFTVHTNAFAAVAAPVVASDKCLASGQAVKNRLMEDLTVRRPVVVCLLIGGLPEWGTTSGSHCVAITGYRKPRGGTMTLITRNSWGNDRNPDIPEDRFCRIHEVTSIRP